MPVSKNEVPTKITDKVRNDKDLDHRDSVLCLKINDLVMSEEIRCGR